MKKLLSLALAGVMALSLAACGSTPSSTPASTPASGSTSASTPASEPAEEFETVDPVSYTHLDVYKRQVTKYYKQFLLFPFDTSVLYNEKG